MAQNSATVSNNITSKTSLNSTTKSRQWLASLALDFSHNVLGTQLSRTKRNGPLSVQKAFYPEGVDCAHIYLLHPPAGIVSGDELQVDITLAPIDDQTLNTNRQRALHKYMGSSFDEFSTTRSF